MNIEEIMKPYFDKKEEFEKKYTEEKNSLKLRLERLRENKASEIQEYINNALNSNQNFYVGYGAMLRKDLEQSYAEREAQLEREINDFDKFYRVDVREVSDIKQEVRKDLFSAKKELEIRLQEVELNYKIVMLNLSKIKLEYDEQHRVLNGDAYKSIYAQADSLIDVKRNIQKELDSVNKYIAETELTKEEIRVLMMSMTPWEREEYDRRKSLNSLLKDLEHAIVDDGVTKQGDTLVGQTQVQDTGDTLVGQTQVQDTGVNDNVAEALDEFLFEIFMDILDNAIDNHIGYDSIDTLDIEKVDDTIELTNKYYYNSKDLIKATKDYYKKDKGNKHKVKGIEEDLTITRKGLRRLKKAIKKCSTVILLKDNKLGSTDIKRVYGKEIADQYNEELKEIGTIETNAKEGVYLSSKQYVSNLKHLFGVKRDSWLNKLISKIKPKQEETQPVDTIESLDSIIENLKKELLIIRVNSEYQSKLKSFLESNLDLKQTLETLCFEQPERIEKLEDILASYPELKDMIAVDSIDQKEATVKIK